MQWLFAYEFYQSMKTNQEINMINEVHKNVKFMIEEAKIILKSSHLPKINRKINTYLEDYKTYKKLNYSIKSLINTEKQQSTQRVRLSAKSYHNVISKEAIQPRIRFNNLLRYRQMNTEQELKQQIFSQQQSELLEYNNRVKGFKNDRNKSQQKPKYLLPLIGKKKITQQLTQPSKHFLTISNEHDESAQRSQLILSTIQPLKNSQFIELIKKKKLHSSLLNRDQIPKSKSKRKPKLQNLDEIKCQPWKNEISEEPYESF